MKLEKAKKTENEKIIVKLICGILNSVKLKNEERDIVEEITT